MDHVDDLGHLGERDRPVDGGIAAAGDHDAPAAEVLAPLDQIEDALALIGLDARQRRLVGAEGAHAGRDDDGAGIDAAAVVEQDMPALADGDQLCRPAAQMIDGMEGSGLLLQLGDQLGGVDRGIAGDVVDRLLRIERRALPAGHVEGIDHMAVHLQHAAFEDREEADRPRADDANIRPMLCRHGTPRRRRR